MDPNPLTQIELDRLADGELKQAERRELLMRLERSTDGWRRCALAFVERQALDQSLRSLTDEANSRAMLDRQPAARSEKRAERYVGWWAIAASALVAFGLGVATRGLETVGTPGDSIVSAVEHAAPHAPGAELPPGRQPQPAIAGDDAVEFWVDAGAEGRRSLQTQLVDADQLDTKFGTQFRSAVPDALRRRLEQRGYQIKSRQRYAPIYLGDGQPVVVPVEDLQIVPVRAEVF